MYKSPAKLISLFIVMFLVTGCITSIDPYFTEDHPDAVSPFPKNFSVSTTQYIVTPRLKDGFTKTYETDEYDNIVFIHKVDPKTGRDIHIMQATGKESRITYYIPFGYYEGIDLLFRGSVVEFTQISPVNVELNHLKSLVAANNKYAKDPWDQWNRKKKNLPPLREVVLFENRRVNDRYVLDYDIEFFESAVTRVKTQRAVRFNVEDYAKIDNLVENRTGPPTFGSIVLLDENLEHQKQIADTLKSELKHYGAILSVSKPEQAVSDAFAKYVFDNCNKGFFLKLAGQNGGFGSAGALISNFEKVGDDCVISTLTERLAFGVGRTSGVKCDTRGEESSCTFNYYLYCESASSSGATPLSCTFLSGLPGRGAGVIRKQPDGRYKTISMNVLGP